MQELMWRGVLADGQARWVMISGREMAEEARRIHRTTPVMTAALGRVLMGTAMMSATLKAETDRLTLTFAGGGPAGKLVAVGREGGVVKAYVDHPEADAPIRTSDGKLDVGAVVGSDGTLTVVKDLGLREPYVGQCPLSSGEIAQDLALYYAESEQQPTLLSLGVLIQTDGSVQAAGGLLVQPMPGCSEEVLDCLEFRSPLYADMSGHMAAEEQPEALLELFFSGLSPKVLDKGVPRFACDCNRARIERVLLSLGRQELQDMIDQDGQAQVHCHFCQKDYDFDKAQLEALLEATE